MIFWRELLTYMYSGFVGLESEQPRAMLLLIAGVSFGVVCLVLLPHSPEDLEPALAQTAQSAGVS